MMLTKSPGSGTSQSAPKKKLEDKGEEMKNAKQRHLEKVMPHVRQSTRRSRKGGKSDSGGNPEALTCSICATTFSSKSYAKFCVHMKKEHFLEVHYQCQACLKTFSNQRLLQHHKCHVLTASSDKQSKVQHTCSLCQLVFSSLYDINLHRWSSHGAKAYHCLQCSRLLGSVANLTDHVHAHSRRRKVTLNRRPFSSHRRQKLLFNKPKSKPMKKNSDASKAFQCDFCKLIFTDLSLAMEHRRRVHKENKLICNCCQQKFPDANLLSQHLASVWEDLSSPDAELTDTAISSSSSGKEGVDTEKRLSVPGVPSSDTDIAPASSSVTESPTSGNVCDYTTDEDLGISSKKYLKTEIQGEVSKSPSPAKLQSIVNNVPQVNKSPVLTASRQCCSCKLTFVPKTTESEQATCPKCNAVSKTVNLPNKNKKKSKPPLIVTELLSEKPKRKTVAKKVRTVGQAKKCSSETTTSKETESPKSDDEDDMSEDLSVGSKEAKKNYVCDFCEQGFGSVTWVMRHRKKSHEGAQLKCNVCQIKFLQSSDLGHHLAECRQETASPLCSDTPSSNNACSSTLPLPVEKISGKSYACDFCSQSFASVSWVMRHRKQHVDDLGNYWCRACFETFDKSADFGRHLAHCVGVRKTTSDPNSNVVPDKKETSVTAATPEKEREMEKENEKEKDAEKNSPLKRRFRCDFCSQKFASIRWVIRHRQQHTDDYICQICSLAFDRTVELGRHLAAGCALVDSEPEPSVAKPDSKPKKTKSDDGTKKEFSPEDVKIEPCLSSENKDDNPVYPCDFCQQKFASGRWVIRHRKQHERGETLACQRCQLKFNRSVDLGKHLSVCPKMQDTATTLYQSSSSTAEGAVEDGHERSFQCDICGQNYASARWVMRHRRSHNTSEFPYVCRNCKCSFNRSVEISQHLRSCHSSFAPSVAVKPIIKSAPNNSEIPITAASITALISNRPLPDKSEKSFLNNAKLNITGARPKTPNNGSPLPAHIKIENIPAASTPMNLSFRPDSEDKSNKNTKASLKGPSAPGDTQNINYFTKTPSPLDLVQRKKVSSMTKKENKDTLTNASTNKILNLSVVENKVLNLSNAKNLNNVKSKTLNLSNAESKTQNLNNVKSKTLNLSNAESKTQNLNNVKSKTLNLSNVERKTLNLSNVERKTLNLSNVERKTLNLSNVERKTLNLSNAGSKTLNFNNAESKTPNLINAKSKIPNLGNAKSKIPNLSNAESKTPNLSNAKSKILNLSDAESRSLNLSDAESRSLNLSDAESRSLNFSDAESKSLNFSDSESKSLNLSDAESKSISSKISKDQLQEQQAPNVKSFKTGTKFSCDYCPNKFPDVITLLTHRGKHSLSSSCHKCGKKYAKCIEVCQHLERCIQANSPAGSSLSQSIPKQFYCDFCLKTYGGSNWIMRHRRKHTDEKEYMCRVCKFSTKGAGFMARHLASCRWIKANLVNNGFQPKKTVASPFVFSPSSTVTCDFCSASFQSIPDLIQHRKFHTSEELPKCQYCGTTVVSQKQMATHLVSCHAHPNNHKFVPPNLNRNGIVKPGDFKMKYLPPKEPGGRIDGEKVFTCDFCGQGFASCAMVMQHRRLHTKESHVCRNCGNLFALSEMGVHLSICKKRSHSNLTMLSSANSQATSDSETGALDLKKIYTCDFCNKTFDTSNRMMRHRLNHTSNVPYKCYRCSQIFNLAHSMANHLTTCHLSSSGGQVSRQMAPKSEKMMYLCDRCGGHFPHTEVTRVNEGVTYRCHYCLKQKSVNHSPNQKIDGTCAYCVAGFDSPTSLQNHLKNCTANRNRNEFYINQKAGVTHVEEVGRHITAAPPAHSKIQEPCYLEPQDLSKNSFRNFAPPSVNRFSATSLHKSFYVKEQPQKTLGSASLLETPPKPFRDERYVSKDSFERTFDQGQKPSTVPLVGFDKSNSVWDGSSKHFEKQSVLEVPTDLRVESNNSHKIEKEKSNPSDKDIAGWQPELNGKDKIKTESVLSEHPSSNTSCTNAKEKFTQCLNLISKSSKFPCDFCEAAFPKDTLLISHRLTHVDENNMWCRLCQRGFGSASNFVSHLACCKMKHKNTAPLWQLPSLNKKEPFRCDFCDKSFTHRHAVMRHRLEHEQEEGIFRCRRCEFVFYTSSVFFGHLSVCMSRISSPNRSRGTYWSSYGKNGYIGSWRRLVSSNREKIQKMYYCDFCRRRFGGSNWIMRHRRTHVDGCVYTCQLCGLVFKQAGLMADHLSQCYSPSSGRDTPNQSKSSGSESATTSSPKVDGLTSGDSEKDSDDKPLLIISPHQCKLCAVVFDSKEDFESHSKSCNKRQDSKPHLLTTNQKQKTAFETSLSPPPPPRPPTLLPLPKAPIPPTTPARSNKTEFPCDFCGRCFLGVSWILRHRHTHVADPRDLKCRHCRRDFDNTSSFVSHLNSCLKPANCSAIQKAFLSKYTSASSTLVRESESGSGSSEVEENNNTFTFECCSQTFSQVVDLTAHMKTHSRQPSS